MKKKTTPSFAIVKFYLMVLVSALLAMVAMPVKASAQVWMTRTGHIQFFSHTPLEDIKADNHQVTSSLNTENGQVAFVVPMKGFEFPNRTMQEHYNDTYLETDKYPRATFQGTIKDLEKYDLTQDGTYNVEVEGDMTIHGQTNKMTIPGTLVVKGGQIEASSKFMLTLADYNIDISAASRRIAEQVEVTVALTYKRR